MIANFWEHGINPVTGWKLNLNYNANKKQTPVVTLKSETFDPDIYIHINILKEKYNIGSVELGKKIKGAGFEKITYSNKRYVLREFEAYLK